MLSYFHGSSVWLPARGAGPFDTPLRGYSG